ncbi:hypothetical protein PF438_09525 [Elizabethkingia meningoseptica]|uniref:hypothetical protein n=1 Tax=Elizabethkingia TaxID=308865 RepID=UPI0021A5E08D|nr:hypothetical protein [Elizabethkingia meningoseptica]EJK5330256.1 hypothetical protein [Elizabethkingia meningoseptica]MCT4074670.1 hypothetical protein [Elizabethkingia anophelis]WBS73146.1 hypothetical protein PF438_09525 [Elizabethkingia meningoseptica]
MMTNDEKKEQNLSKKEYIPPKIEVVLIEMEEGIAAGSAQAIPQQSTTTETWETENIDGTLDW